MERYTSNDLHKLAAWLQQQGIVAMYPQGSNPDGRKRWELKLVGKPTVSFRSTRDCVMYLRGACDAEAVTRRLVDAENGN